MKSYFMPDFLFLMVNNRVEILHSHYAKLLADSSVYVYWLTREQRCTFWWSLPQVSLVIISTSVTCIQFQIFSDNLSVLNMKLVTSDGWYWFHCWHYKQQSNRLLQITLAISPYSTVSYRLQIQALNWDTKMPTLLCVSVLLVQL